jgi:hypothetical protein
MTSEGFEYTVKLTNGCEGEGTLDGVSIPGERAGALNRRLIFLIIDCNWFQVLCLEHMIAKQTANIFNSVPPGNQLSLFVLTILLHNLRPLF